MNIRQLILWISLCLSITLSAQQPSDGMFQIDSVTNFFNRQLIVYPQEKIYAQIDKPVYIAGEDIWFRAYIVNATWHLPDTTSRYVYGELITPHNKIQNRVKVRLENGAYQGYIPLDEKLPGGNYKLRFYTRYLEGLGKDYFFERDITIGTLAQLTASEGNTTNQRKRSVVKPMDYQVDFFPEGGVLPEGAVSRIAFKALNEKGLGEDITGCILNVKGDTILEFASEHVGMGSFVCITKANDPLVAVCTNREGVEKQFPLPLPDIDAFSLKVSTYRERLFVTITRSPDFALPESLYLLAFCQGVIFYCQPWDLSWEMVVFDETTLPQGIIQFVLVDGVGNPVSERLAFNRRNPFPVDLSFFTDKTRYGAREKVESTVAIVDGKGQPLKGNFSVSVTDDRDVLPDSCVHILTALLLTSELKGHIENPGYYFRNENATTLHNLDNLLLTQGWSRYEVKDILKGRLQTPPVPREISMQVAGQVKGGVFLNRTGEGYPVTLFSLSPFVYEETQTDENGNFLFNYFEGPDSITYVLQGRNKKGGLRAEMIYKEETFPSVSPFIPVRKNQSDSLTFKQYLQKADNQLLLTKGIRTIHLSDVVVIADKKPVSGRSTFSSGFNERYGEDYINQRNFSTMFDLLRQLPGLTVSGDKVYITRNMYSSFSGETDALILIDDVIVEQEMLQSISVQDVEEIEIAKGGNAAIFGMRGGNGAIMITTKRGEFNVQQKESFHIRSITPLGFQVTKHFYSPSYEVVESTDMINPDLRTTLYWNPIVKIGEDGKAKFDFYTAETFSNYSVVIEGVTNDGRIIRMIEKIKGTLE